MREERKREKKKEREEEEREARSKEGIIDVRWGERGGLPSTGTRREE